MKQYVIANVVRIEHRQNILLQVNIVWRKSYAKGMSLMSFVFTFAEFFDGFSEKKEKNRNSMEEIHFKDSLE